RIVVHRRRHRRKTLLAGRNRAGQTQLPFSSRHIAAIAPPRQARRAGLLYDRCAEAWMVGGVGLRAVGADCRSAGLRTIASWQATRLICRLGGRRLDYMFA